ncbi:MAG: hypothetical protein A2901_09575 [Elusimicrobia bacterium RIFCSPLOWO2_01_FULL_54_10]|nr:MAG: hypothetical protein A2901_09575 [Elusimicrobia bacterium RIFCSPLOWO2_01_FULL_54_10]
MTSASLTLKELVPQIVRRLGVSERNFEVVSLIEREIQKISPKSSVAAYKNDKIYVEVESSAHLFELNMRRREILKSLSVHAELPCPELKLFLKGTVRASAADRLKNALKIPQERK